MIGVTLAAAPDGLAVEITDSGVAFDPTAPPTEPSHDLAATTPGGRGLPTVHRTATALDYRREGGEESGENRLRFRIPAAR